MCCCIYLCPWLYEWRSCMWSKTRKQSGKDIQLLWVKHIKCKKEKLLIKRALPSLRSATEQLPNPLTQWSACGVCLYEIDVVIYSRRTWIYENAATTWTWCGTLIFVFMQLHKADKQFKVSTVHWRQSTHCVFIEYSVKMELLKYSEDGNNDKMAYFKILK